MGPCAGFADLLEYPAADPGPRAAACRELLSSAEARAELERFEESAAALGVGRLEEEYASAFDLDGACALYAGHQLFGEDGRRNLLLCGLAGEYRAHGFARPPGEPPDYLPLLLRYLDTADPAGGATDTIRAELRADVVLPAACRLAAALAARAHPYAPVLRALVLTLGGATASGRQRPAGAAEGSSA